MATWMIFFAIDAKPASVTLQWNQNPESDVIGYKVYFGAVSTIPGNVIDAGNTTNAVVSGLQEGATYDFYASAYNSSGLESDLSAPVTHTISTSSNELLVSWGESFSPTVATYALLYRTGNQSTFLHQDAGTNLSAAISNVVRETTYELTVEAYDASGSTVTVYEVKSYTIPQSGNIGSVHLLPIDQPPIVVLTSPANGSNFTEPASIQISANASDDDVVQFVDLFNATNLLARLTTPPYTFVWENVPRAEYEIYAVAVDNWNQFTRSESAIVSVQETTSTLMPPSAPESLSSRQNKHTGGVLLTWSDTSDNEEAFNIERSLDGSAFNVIGTVANNTTLFTDAYIQPRSRYYYRVRAVNAAGSNVSTVISVRVR
jgi:hypothetical protein